MEVVVELAFVNKLRMFSVNRLYFHSYFEICLGICCLVNLSEGSLIDFSDDSEVFADFLEHLMN